MNPGRFSITFTSGCPSVLSQLPQAIFAWFKADIAFANWGYDYYPQGEIVQTLRRYDFKLPARDVEAQQGFRLRYESDLDTEWNVDFQFRIQFDSAAFELGDIITGPRAGTHRISVEKVGPDEVLIRGTRVGDAGMNGRGTILEIPFTLHQGKNSPATLPLVELVAMR